MHPEYIACLLFVRKVIDCQCCCSDCLLQSSSAESTHNRFAIVQMHLHSSIGKAVIGNGGMVSIEYCLLLLYDGVQLISVPSAML